MSEEIAAPAAPAAPVMPQAADVTTENRFEQMRQAMVTPQPVQDPVAEAVAALPELADINAGMDEPVTEEELLAALGSEAPATEEITGEQGEDLVEFAIPGTAEGEEEVVIPVADPVAAERLSKLIQQADGNAGEMGVMREEYEAGMREYDTFLGSLRSDPVGTIAGLLGNEQTLADFATEMLALRPNVQKQVLSALGKFEEDPRNMDVWKSQLQARESQRKAAASQFVQDKQFARNWQREVTRQVRSLIPPTLSPEARAIAFRDAVSDIRIAIEQNDGYYFDPSELPTKLSARVKLWQGASPSIPKPANPASGSSAVPANPPAGTVPPSGPTAAEIAKAARTPEAIRAAIRAHRAQKAIAGTGGGGLPASAERVDLSKSGTKEAFEVLKSRLGTR